MATDKILIHTRLFSEDSYQIISACKQAQYHSLQIFSLDRDALFDIDRTRKTNHGFNYQILRAPNGEVLVYHAPSRWDTNNTDSLRSIKGAIKDFIKSISLVVGEDEQFIILPFPIFLKESTDVASDSVKRRIYADCHFASTFMVEAKAFIYEKTDVDYIYSHPFTVRKLKDAFDKIGSKAIDDEDGELDPFITEQHKMVLDAFIRLYEHIASTSATRANKLNALRDILSLYSITVDEDGTPVLHNFLSTLPIALKVNLKDDVFKFVDNFKSVYDADSRCVSFTDNQNFVFQKDQIKEELDRDLFSTEVYKNFLSSLEIASDANFYKFPSPALICSHWKDYEAVL